MKTLSERFWAKVDKTDGCWNWTGAVKRRKPYGVFSVNGKAKRAHRVAWELTNGPIQDDLCLLHKCDNPSCCRVDHLFLGSPSDNSRDMVQKNRHHRGEKRTNSKLNESAVNNIRKYYAGGAVTQRWLADVYGVSRQLIGHVVSGKTWKHVSA